MTLLCVNTSHVTVHLSRHGKPYVIVRSVNTSHVTVHPITDAILKRSKEVSIHPMLLFISNMTATL